MPIYKTMNMTNKYYNNYILCQMFFKMIYFYVYLINTILCNCFISLRCPLKDKKMLRFRVIHLIEVIQSNNFHIY